MAEEPKKLVVQPMIRFPVQGLDSPQPTPMAKDILGEAYDPCWQWFKREGVVPPRNVPSTAFHLDDEFDWGVEELAYGATSKSRAALYNGIRKATMLSYYYPDWMCVEMLRIMEHLFGPSVGHCDVISLDEVLQQSDINWWASGAFPLYYFSQDKLSAFLNYESWVVNKVKRLWELKGDTQVFTATLKDELVAMKKVLAEVTRIFKNGTLPLFLFAKMLFSQQMQRMQEHLGDHPSTIGIDLPGPGFINLFDEMAQGFRMAKEMYSHLPGEWFVKMRDGDRSGHDFSVSLSVVAVGRDWRKSHNPAWSCPAIDAYYSHVYCGYSAVGGNLVRWPGQQSGQLLTGDDNSITVAVNEYPALRDLMDSPESGITPLEVYCDGFRKCNGDDDMAVEIFNRDISIEEYGERLKNIGVYFSTQSGWTEDAYDMMFLSHKPKKIYVPDIDQEIMVAAPRADKLTSALRWKKGKNDANNLRRVNAIVNGLFPYPDIFEEKRIRADKWYHENPRSWNPDAEWLAARTTGLTRRQLASMHTGYHFG